MREQVTGSRQFRVALNASGSYRTIGLSRKGTISGVEGLGGFGRVVETREDNCRIGINRVME
jgi:hypothetical protein